MSKALQQLSAPCTAKLSTEHFSYIIKPTCNSYRPDKKIHKNEFMSAERSDVKCLN
ncbi:MAG: hypothetical protein HFK00_03080 [Oscillospiraceae bacterium]|nr:hypothetical protein [Oscillospiraceae bacterium]